MPPPSPLAVPDPWNAVAEGYADEVAPLFEPYARDALALAALPPAAHVLDVAAGPGTLALVAAPHAGRVVAVDFAEDMVAILRSRVAAGGTPNVEALVADGQALPFDDATFDGAFSMFGLMFFPDRAAGFREMARVLRPGGRAVVSGWAPLDEVPLLTAMFGAVAALLPCFPLGGGGAPLADVDAFRSEMAGGGFRDVEVHTVVHGSVSPSVGAFWASNARGSAPLSLVRARMSGAAWEVLAAGVVSRLEDEFGSGPVEVRWPARLGVGAR